MATSKKKKGEMEDRNRTKWTKNAFPTKQRNDKEMQPKQKQIKEMPEQKRVFGIHIQYIHFASESLLCIQSINTYW